MKRMLVSCQDLTRNTVYEAAKGEVEVKKLLSNGYTVPIWRVVGKERVYTKASKVLVTYECQTCKTHNTITLALFYRKLIKASTTCTTCCNMNLEKRRAHSDWLKSFGANGKKVEPKPRKEKVATLRADTSRFIEQSRVEFDAMDDEFKHQYFRKYLELEEFERHRAKICSFQHDKIAMSDDIVYLPVLKVSNQFKFYPHFYVKSRDCIEKACYIKWCCDNCGSCFENKTLEVQKNRYKILCPECSFCNDTFKIRSDKNIEGKVVRYQSKFEHKFITWCDEHGILLENGPRVPYTMKGATHHYAVDFFLPTLSRLIEFKDHHVWHKRQLESGKWQLKEAAARAHALEHGLAFEIVYPSTYMAFLKSIKI